MSEGISQVYNKIPQFLDGIGRGFISLDYRITGFIVLVSIIVISVYKKYLLRRSTKDFVIVRLLLGLATIYSGLVVIAVFLFTRPPAVSDLDGSLLWIIGLIVFFICMHIGAREVRLFLAASGGAPGERGGPGAGPVRVAKHTPD